MPIAKYKGVPEGYKVRGTKSVNNNLRTEWGRNRYSTAFYAGSSTMTGTATTVSVNFVNSNSYIVVMPSNAPSGTKWWVTKGNGSFTVHSNSSESSVSFDYFVSNARLY